MPVSRKRDIQFGAEEIVPDITIILYNKNETSSPNSFLPFKHRMEINRSTYVIFYAVFILIIIVI